MRDADLPRWVTSRRGLPRTALFPECARAVVERLQRDVGAGVAAQVHARRIWNTPAWVESSTPGTVAAPKIASLSRRTSLRT
ncbi:MAG: hypothetical protein ACXVHQ_41220 [Solirubrobacteraceae bacterium]